ncbi:MAG: hypothetical protein PHQ58_23205 [Rhodoferax sp.]|uniref:hypothetical protein n=1 Tax=Rhodoferax sp. TaxID=50421 RepID=UPI00263773F2|nr:hypothetical protein [Rhodoferax sp.]MDD2883329.1 hypothetical protein [Rhodoferax sp.]
MNSTNVDRPSLSMDKIPITPQSPYWNEANAAHMLFGTPSLPEPLKDVVGVSGRRHNPMPATNCECFNPVALIKQAQTATYYVALKKE